MRKVDGGNIGHGNGAKSAEGGGTDHRDTIPSDVATHLETTRDLVSRLEAIEDQLADAITEGEAWGGVDEAHPFYNVIGAKNGIVDLIRDADAGKFAECIFVRGRAVVREDSVDAAMAAIDKLNALAWLMTGAFDGGTPSESVAEGMHSILAESTDALAAFVNEAWGGAREA